MEEIRTALFVLAAILQGLGADLLVVLLEGLSLSRVY